MEKKDKIEDTDKGQEISVFMLTSIVRSQLLYFRSKWKFVLICFTIGAVLGIAYSIIKKPKYLAQTTFTIEEPNVSAAGLSGLASQLGLSMSSDKQGIFEGNNIIAFFQSRLMVQKTLLTEAPFEHGNVLLVNRYIDFNHYRDSWKKDPKLANLTFEPNKPLTRLQDSILNIFYKDIVLKQLNVEKLDRRLTILTLTYICGDELFAKEFSAALAKNVIEVYIANRTEKSAQTVAILQRQADSVKARLNKSLTSVASSNDATPNANPLKSILGVSTQNRSVDAEIDRAALVQLSSNLQAAKIQLNQQTPLIDFIDTPILPLEVIKFTKIKGVILGGALGTILALIILTLRRRTY